MNIEQKLEELQIQLPELDNSNRPFDLGVVVDKLVFLSGQTCNIEGKVVHPGKVGADVTIEEAEAASVICISRLLAGLKYLIGDLNKVKRIVKVNGYVASNPDFIDQAKLMDYPSKLLNDIFGWEHKHARAAVGVATLPGDAPIELEMIVEIEN